MKSSSLRRRRLLAAPAALLRPILVERLRLHVAAVRQRDHHVRRRDQVLERQIDALRDDLRAACVAELVADRGELVVDDRRDARRLRQDVDQVDDLGHHVAVFAEDLVLFEAGQPLQPQFEDRLRLRVGELVAVRPSSCQPNSSGSPSGLAESAAARLSISSTSGERQVLPISAIFASDGAGAALMSAMISSTFDSATARPSRMWPRSRALRSS